MYQTIDGHFLAQNIQNQLKNSIQKYEDKKLRRPYLAVVLIGDNPASKIYVQNKQKACEDVGIHSLAVHKEANTSEDELCKLIEKLNDDPMVDGILLQLPLPSHIDSFKILSKIDMHKDVDGLSPMNQGLLMLNKSAHVPCTPSGIIKMLESISFKFEGSLAAVVGRSILVGSPVAKLLSHKNATVINIHSRTKNPWELTKQADLLIAAVGSPKLISPKWVKEGAVIIDVGIHRIDGKLCGDVDFEAVKEKTSWITPVPKGVGPMTIACLLVNCFNAYKQKFGLD
jgi:methylenetetrahydrofolate dehydrogenase (NADP+)/methenyltetrahydrofolate cyclohydrolase